MTPEQELVPFPPFGDNSSRIQPDAPKYAAGFQESDVLPAEWLNWFLNKASAGTTVLNTVGDATQKELNTLLVKGNITPDATKTDQVYEAIKSFVQNTVSLVMCDTAADEPPAATDNSVVTAYFSKLRVNVMIKNGYYAEDEETAMTFNYKELGSKKIFVPKDGKLVEIQSVNKDRGTGAKNWYCQPFTKFELEYDGTLDESNGGWIVLNNPIVLSNSDVSSGYSIRANGENLPTYPQLNNALANYVQTIDAKAEITGIGATTLSTTEIQRIPYPANCTQSNSILIGVRLNTNLAQIVSLNSKYFNIILDKYDIAFQLTDLGLSTSAGCPLTLHFLRVF